MDLRIWTIKDRVSSPSTRARSGFCKRITNVLFQSPNYLCTGYQYISYHMVLLRLRNNKPNLATVGYISYMHGNAPTSGNAARYIKKIIPDSNNRSISRWSFPLIFYLLHLPERLHLMRPHSMHACCVPSRCRLESSSILKVVPTNLVVNNSRLKRVRKVWLGVYRSDRGIVVLGCRVEFN